MIDEETLRFWCGEPIKYTWYNKLYRWVFRLPQQYDNAWSAEEIEILEARKQPPIVFNRISPVAAQISELLKDTD